MKTKRMLRLRIEGEEDHVVWVEFDHVVYVREFNGKTEVGTTTVSFLTKEKAEHINYKLERFER